VTSVVPELRASAIARRRTEEERDEAFFLGERRRRRRIQSAMREQLSNSGAGLWSRPRISFGPCVAPVATETVGSFGAEVDHDFG
jgi:hypothetical protein